MHGPDCRWSIQLMNSATHCLLPLSTTTTHHPHSSTSQQLPTHLRVAFMFPRASSSTLPHTNSEWPQATSLDTATRGEHGHDVCGHSSEHLPVSYLADNSSWSTILRPRHALCRDRDGCKHLVVASNRLCPALPESRSRSRPEPTPIMSKPTPLRASMILSPQWVTSVRRKTRQK